MMKYILLTLLSAALVGAQEHSEVLSSLSSSESLSELSESYEAEPLEEVEPVEELDAIAEGELRELRLKKHNRPSYSSKAVYSTPSYHKTQPIVRVTKGAPTKGRHLGARSWKKNSYTTSKKAPLPTYTKKTYIPVATKGKSYAPVATKGKSYAPISTKGKSSWNKRYLSHKNKKVSYPTYSKKTVAPIAYTKEPTVVRNKATSYGKGKRYLKARRSHKGKYHSRPTYTKKSYVAATPSKKAPVVQSKAPEPLHKYEPAVESKDWIFGYSA